MAIARSPVLVIDCPDADTLATFYGRLLDWQVVPAVPGGDWAKAFDPRTGQLICFQPTEEPYRAPTWPTQEAPQQYHLDVVVDDLDVAETEVLALGARKHEHQPGTTFRVFLDPAGHPFCLCLAD